MAPSLKYDAERLYKIYGDMAKGDVGAIITSFPLVDQEYYTDRKAPENRDRVYEKLVTLCHNENCPVIAQLVLVNYRGNMSVDRMAVSDI